MDFPLVSESPTSGRIDGWRDFQERFRALLEQAAASSGELRWVDADFVHWPLGERAVCELLQQWMRQHAGARLTVLAGRFDAMQREHPRWLTWRQTWSHRVSCWQASDEIAADLRPACIWRDRSGEVAGLRLLDAVSAVGQWSADPAVLSLWQADFDAYLQRSSEGGASSVLGL